MTPQSFRYSQWLTPVGMYSISSFRTVSTRVTQNCRTNTHKLRPSVPLSQVFVTTSGRYHIRWYRCDIGVVPTILRWTLWLGGWVIPFGWRGLCSGLGLYILFHNLGLLTHPIQTGTVLSTTHTTMCLTIPALPTTCLSIICIHNIKRTVEFP